MIRFGENILDLIQEVSCEDLATVIIPLGKRDEDTDERLTIKSVNGGRDYLEDPDAIALYGRIVKTVEYDDVTLPENLLRKGREVLNWQKLLIPSITITAMYLNTSTYNTYRCTVAGAAAAAKWVYVNNIKGAKGDQGNAGADAITMTITSSNGTIFKNTAITTTLTAHVYKAGAELDATAIAALGTIKWYKDGSTTPLSTTGQTLNIGSGDIDNKATYIAQLEG